VSIQLAQEPETLEPDPVTLRPPSGLTNDELHLASRFKEAEIESVRAFRAYAHSVDLVAKAKSVLSQVEIRLQLCPDPEPSSTDREDLEAAKEYVDRVNRAARDADDRRELANRKKEDLLQELVRAFRGWA
jgi:hypothetical protein